MKTVHDFFCKKQNQQKISMVTCYDYTMARIVEKTNVDCVLVGDSLSMVMHGFTNTTFATLDLMALHTQAVARGLKTKFIVGDLPFLSYRKSLSETMDAVGQLIRAGAHAVKLEGAQGNLKTIEHIVESGVPVMGHIGLTPQMIGTLGGFKVQGKKESEYRQLIDDAVSLQDAGCFALVLECIPAALAKEISSLLKIPTIGIGAGPDVDGQVLVIQDLLGMQTDFQPKFLKHFLQGAALMEDSINQFVEDVDQVAYPTKEYSY